MSINLSKDDYNRLSAGRKSAFKKIADTLGPKHRITNMMGGLAWGRHEGEQGASDNTLRSAIEEFGFLEGFYDALNLWARDNDHEAQRVMIALMPRGYHLPNRGGK